MRAFMRPAFALAMVANLFVLAPERAEAGCVVLKNGEVIIGRIRVEEDDKEQLIVRWPYLDRTERGHVVIPHFRIRWYDRDADEPTDAYWKDHEKEPIDNRYLPLLERYRMRQTTQDDVLHVPVGPLLTGGGGVALAVIPHQTQEFTVRLPKGWNKRDEDGITIFESDRPGPDDYRARIHIFTVETVEETTNEDQVSWIETEIQKLGSGRDFDRREEKKPYAVPGGLDHEMVTATSRGGRTIVALRRVAFRRKRTYFFTAYAHESEFNRLKGVFKESLASFKIIEDEAAPASDGGTPAGTNEDQDG